MALVEELITTFLLGVGAPLVSPCILPLYPGFIAYLSGRIKADTGQDTLNSTQSSPTNVKILGILVFLGVVTMMLLLGFIIAALSISVGNALAIITPISYFIIILLGILLLMNKNIFERIPRLQLPVVKNPYANAYVYGLFYGPIALPCSGPVAVSVFALSLGVADVLSKVLLFFVFGLGFGLPLIALAFLPKNAVDWLMNKFTSNYRKLNLVAGVLLITIGIYEFYINWDSIVIFLTS
jgi:cytochrome c-type biogenesis protein